MKPCLQSVLLSMLVTANLNANPTCAANPDPQIAKGWALYYTGKFQELFDYVHLKVKEKNHNSAWDELLGLAYCDGDLATVSKFFPQVQSDIIAEPKNSHLLATAAILLVRITGKKEGMKYVTQPAVNLNRQAMNIAMTAVAVAPNDARSHAALGAAYGALNQTKEAVAEFDKALKLAPLDIDVNVLASDFYVNVLFDTKKGDQCFDRLVKAYPDNPYVWHRLASAREQSGNLNGAVEAYNIAIQKGSKDHSTMQDLYGLYRHMGKNAEALKVINTMIALNMHMYPEREYCYEQLHQYDKALVDMTKCIVIANQDTSRKAKSMNVKFHLVKDDAFVPEFATVEKDYRRLFVTRANLYDKLGKYDLAIADINPVLQESPRYEAGLELRQAWYRKTDRYKDALTDLNKLVIIAPTAARYTARADAYSHLGEKDKANLDTKRAKEIGQTDSF
jgi:tetratricopeptide (TPR) repeat protein